MYLRDLGAFSKFAEFTRQKINRKVQKTILVNPEMQLFDVFDLDVVSF